MTGTITYECMKAAGRDPELLHTKRLLVAGCGNAGSNATLTLAVLGIEAAYVDPDRAEPKNLAHSPFLEATRSPDGSTPFKAELLAKHHVALSRRPDQLAHWAAVPIQALPLGVLRQFHGMIIGIDDGPSRAWAARAGALLGIPTIVVGLYPPTGNFVATANSDPASPCYFCLRPDESPVRASCSLYSDPDGRVNPALQTAAAALMSVAVEAMTRFWHGDNRYDGKVFRLDLGDGSAETTGFRAHPNCPGPHESLPEVLLAPFASDTTVATVLELAKKDGLKAPVLHVPSPFIVSMPCRQCGADVLLNQADWQVKRAPTCAGRCGKSGNGIGPHIVSSINQASPLVEQPCAALGLGPLALCLVTDEQSDETRVYELPGSLEDVLHTLRK